MFFAQKWLVVTVNLLLLTDVAVECVWLFSLIYNGVKNYSWSRHRPDGRIVCLRFQIVKIKQVDFKMSTKKMNNDK